MTEASFSRVLRHPIATVASIESAALLVGAAAFVLAFPVALLLFWGHDLAIAGTGSVGEFAGIASAVLAVLAFVLGRVLVARRSHAPTALDGTTRRSEPKLHWFDVAALALAHGIIALLAWVGLTDLLGQSFQGAVLYPFAGAALAGVAAGLTSYVVFLSSVRLTPMLLSLVLAVFLVTGALASMLSASDPQWWQDNLSALGMTDEVSAMTFNLTLIVAGALVTIIARYATAGLPTRTPQEVRGRTLLRLGLVLIGVFLACVGIFPVDEFLAIHNTVATGMGLVFAAMVIGLRRLVPSMPHVFVVLGYVLVAVVAVAAVLFAVGYYNLTATELVAAVVIFSWIILFLRNAGAMAPTEESHAAPAARADARLAAGTA